MQKEIIINNKKVKYNHIIKNVKNINLRIKSDGSIVVSSNCTVSECDIDKFLISKGNFILETLEKFKTKSKITIVKYFEEDELKTLIYSLCKKTYEYFEERGIKYPEIKFRKMKSQWGNCYPKKSRLTFSTNLMYVPYECVEYVVCHEFTHFIVPNHSTEFYRELSKSCPEWKKLKNLLKNCVF